MSKPIATRQAFGEALAELGASHPGIVVLDADLNVRRVYVGGERVQRNRCYSCDESRCARCRQAGRRRSFL